MHQEILSISNFKKIKHIEISGQQNKTQSLDPDSKFQPSPYPSSTGVLDTPVEFICRNM